MDIEKKINDVIDNLRPYLLSDGGDIEFIKFEDGIVYVSMKGVCAECGMLDVTLYEGIENVLKDEIPDVKGVINI